MVRSQSCADGRLSGSNGFAGANGIAEFIPSAAQFMIELQERGKRNSASVVESGRLGKYNA